MLLQHRKRALASRSFLIAVACSSSWIGGGSAYAQCTPQETHKIGAADGSPGTHFGLSVCVDGDTLVVGAARDGQIGLSAGAAYVFERNWGGPENWGQVVKLLASDGAAQDEFGRSVSVSDDTIVVGAWGDSDNGVASGSAYVFDRNPGGGNNWGQVAKLLASDGSEFDGFGLSVSASGDSIVVGAYMAEHNGFPTGGSYVFHRNRGGINTWGEVTKLVSSDANVGDEFGIFVSVSGNTAIVGAPGDDEHGFQAGAAYVFERGSGGSNGWSEVAKLMASDGTAGDQFGSVAVFKDTVLVGAGTDDQNGQYAGSAYIFERDHGGPGKWGEVVKILPYDGGTPDQFGTFVSVFGDMAVVGATRDYSKGPESGSAYVFYRHMNGMDMWGQVAKLYASDAIAWDGYGIPSISASTIVIGATKGFLPGVAYLLSNDFPFPPNAYCTAKPASIPGCVPAIESVGVASATAYFGFTIQTTHTPGNSLGVFLYTHGGSSTPVQGPYGLLCISSSGLFRTGILPSGGTPDACDGMLTFDWNWHAQTVVGSDPASTQPATTVDGQFWYRDPENSGHANLTDAIGFVVCR